MLKPNDPPATEKIRFACPTCRAKVAAPSAYAGRTMRCPKCRESVTVPPSAPPSGDADMPPPLTPAEGETKTAEDPIGNEGALPELPDEGMLLGNDWLVFRCPSCKGATKVHRRNFNKLVACGACRYEFSVGID